MKTTRSTTPGFVGSGHDACRARTGNIPGRTSRSARGYVPGGFGEIISKTASADYTAALLPSYASLLGRAKAARLGDTSVTFSVSDVRDVCDLIDAHT
jgi:hypothetical protein